MRLQNRTEAGTLLATKLHTYRNKDVIVYALPRGGVVIGDEIATYLHAPLDVIITRKISHPFDQEYAIAATDELGHIAGSRHELRKLDVEWLDEQLSNQRQEARRRRLVYVHGRKPLSSHNKIALLVDDGVATGLTLQVALMQLREHHPRKLIVAVPMITESVAQTLKKEIDELVTLETIPHGLFKGSVGAYYLDFPQVSDEQVITILTRHEGRLFHEHPRTHSARNDNDLLKYIYYE